MARKKKASRLNDLDVIDLDEMLSAFDLDALAARLPPGIDARQIAQAIAENGDNALFIDDEVIKDLCGAKIFERGKQLVAMGQLLERSFDGESIQGTVADQNTQYHPAFEFDLTQSSCDCPEPLKGMACSHIAALMWAWRQDLTSFLPARPTPSEVAILMDSSFGDVLKSLTGESDITRALARMTELQTHGAQGGTSPSALPGTAQPNASTGRTQWPLATPVRLSALPLTETLEAEFNTAQLRELAKSLGVKLKGTSKGGYVEQVATELMARVARMRQTPEVLLEGLADEQVSFVRRALTARDYELPLPRNLANTLWTQQTNKDPDKRFPELLETLRRRALLFPTRAYYGYRDVYYQWLPLGGSGGNIPLTTWPRASIVKAAPRRPATPPANFLDAFDLFINAILSTGTQARATLAAHPKAGSTIWLKDWEHDPAEAERLLNSRPGWVPNPQSGISIPLLSPLAAEATARLENQTGLPAAQCEFLFSIACALQLIEAPDALSPQGKGSPTDSQVNARSSAVEEWFALSDEVKFLRAWNAWREQVFFPVEVRHAAEAKNKKNDKPNFQVMRAIGARDFTPREMAAEWCALRRYVTRVLRGLPAGEWIGWPEFRRVLMEFYAECAWSIFSPDQWWFSAAGKSNKLSQTHADDWARSTGAILETILAESLKWFGVIEVDEGEGRGLQSLRLTGLHEWFAQVPLAGADLAALPALPADAKPRPRQAEPVAWLDERQWRLPPAPDRAEFITFARKIGEPGDAPFTYALTPASVERALTQGISVEEMARQFESFGAPMPAGALALCQSIAEHFGRVRIYESVTVLELADDYALRELMANTSLGQHILYTLSPRAVVVESGAVDILVDEMVSRGYTPAVK
jgi:hypothetical protein